MNVEPRNTKTRNGRLHARTLQAFLIGVLLVLGIGTGPDRGLSGSQASPSQATPGGDATVVLAGGCFWGVEAVFEHVRGVRSATSGFARYANPASPVPIEAVRIVFAPSQVSQRQLLEVFFLIAHDPTTRDRQGPDSGPEYRAVVFFQSPPERAAADSYIAELTASHRFARPIVTEVRALAGFTVAPDGHQDYGSRHRDDAYVVRNDAPKLVALQQRFPQLYQKQRAP